MKKYLLILLLLIGCSPSFEITQRYDKFNNVTHNFTSGNLTPIRNGIGIVHFDFGQSITKDTIYNYIKIYYKNLDWLFINEGNSLNLLIDGETIALSGDGSINYREVDSPFISETAIYYCSPQLLKKIVNGRNVEYQIRGKSLVECVLTENNKLNLSEFLNKYEK